MYHQLLRNNDLDNFYDDDAVSAGVFGVFDSRSVVVVVVVVVVGNCVGIGNIAVVCGTTSPTVL